jgi:hypothetical protein
MHNSSGNARSKTLHFFSSSHELYTVTNLCRSHLKFDIKTRSRRGRILAEAAAAGKRRMFHN